MNSPAVIIALFSGAVGAVATSKETKGIVTSVPGVSIAVALMPPLCVVDDGIGTAVTFNAETGFADGQARSYISQLSFQERECQLVAQLQVVTSKVYTEAERSQYQQLLAAKLQRSSDSIGLNLLQIPTASGDLLQQLSAATKPAPPTTTAQLQSSFLESAKLAIESLRLPPPDRLVSYAASTSSVAPLKMQISYLSERDIDRDGQAVLVEDIRRQLDYPIDAGEPKLNR